MRNENPVALAKGFLVVENTLFHGLHCLTFLCPKSQNVIPLLHSSMPQLLRLHKPDPVQLLSCMSLELFSFELDFRSSTPCMFPIGVLTLHLESFSVMFTLKPFLNPLDKIWQMSGPGEVVDLWPFAEEHEEQSHLGNRKAPQGCGDCFAGNDVVPRGSKKDQCQEKAQKGAGRVSG